MKGMKTVQCFSVFPPLGKLSRNVGLRFSTNSVKGIRNPTFQRPSKLKPEEIDPITLKAMKQKVKYDPIPLALYPNVYTVQDIGPEYDISGFELDRQKIFNGTYTCYIPPGSFEYQLPNKGKAEIAFIGRSNVGKSSLVDSLLGGKKIVRISKEAGCTTQINYFAFVNALSKDYNPKPNTIIHEDQHLAYLVDMPGYGFAKRSQQLMKQWNTALRKYLLARDQTTLRRVYILIDSRHGVKQSDAHMMDTLNETSIPYQVSLVFFLFVFLRISNFTASS